MRGATGLPHEPQNVLSAVSAAPHLEQNTDTSCNYCDELERRVRYGQEVARELFATGLLEKLQVLHAFGISFACGSGEKDARLIAILANTLT